MEMLLIFVTLLTAVTSRNLPNTEYVPTEEQLAMIFGENSQIQAKSRVVETPALVPNDSIIFEKPIKPYEKSTINEIHNSVTPETVELNIKIKVNDCIKKGADKNVNQIPEKGDPDIHSRFEELSDTGDRVSLGGDPCPSDKVRFGDNCVTPDPE